MNSAIQKHERHEKQDSKNSNLFEKKYQALLSVCEIELETIDGEASELANGDNNLKDNLIAELITNRFGKILGGNK